jgi:ubiquinone/menaquinone biosynthesis C-methylase UbiE
MPAERYDIIGKSYNTTRRADPYIAEKIYQLLSPRSSGLYLEIGCGTANYLTALSQRGLQFIGVDPSEVMLQQARSKKAGAKFVQASAENLSFDNAYFDGATAILTMHHWQNIYEGLKELHRVLKPGTHLVCFSFTPQQLRGYWLHYYFPKMIERSMLSIPEWGRMEILFVSAGFKELITEPYFVREDLQDHFLYSHKFMPEKYLDQSVRDNISSFAAFSDSDEVSTGLINLEADITSGKIKQVIDQYQNDLGDYLFITAIA